MAAPKSRLGRGLDSLISGGIRAPEAAAPSAPKPTKAVPDSKKGGKKKKTPNGTAAPSPASPAPAITTPELPEGTIPVPPREEASKLGMAEIPMSKIEPNPHQPRKHFNDESLRELSESIRSEGLLQPIVVRAVEDYYELIAGERRWRACQMLKLKRIPARIIEASEASSAVMSLIENLQRENLNPIEEALGFASLLSDFNLTQEAVAERVGKSRAGIANSLRLLQFDREIQGFLARGLLSVGHAKVLLGLEGQDERLLLARQVIERQLSVRDTEKLVQSKRKGGSLTSAGPGRAVPPAEAAAIADLQRSLSSNLSTRVELKHTPKKGRIVIEYYGNDDLQRLLEKMGLAQ